VLYFVRASRPQDHSEAGRIVSLRNSSNTIGNRTRDLPAIIIIIIIIIMLESGGGSTLRPDPFTPEKDAVPIVQEAGWAPGPVWTCAKNLAPTGIRSPDRPPHSQSLYRLSYPGPTEGKERFHKSISSRRNLSSFVHFKKGSKE
jgi:hypothetical protein